MVSLVRLQKHCLNKVLTLQRKISADPRLSFINAGGVLKISSRQSVQNYFQTHRFENREGNLFRLAFCLATNQTNKQTSKQVNKQINTQIQKQQINLKITFVFQFKVDFVTTVELEPGKYFQALHQSFHLISATPLFLRLLY